ncbi:MAG: AAA family ATPase, partial [Lamprobacter sp.]|uniref:AAA family ATPase n=1 Tax=Lamprobacter sp. TaxID=3100796 RepID=UPI002B259BF8
MGPGRNQEIDEIDMLKHLKIINFTAFGKATFDFSEGLNVIVGANGTGKTHVLKLGYLFTRAWSDLSKQRLAPEGKRAEAYFEERLMGLFRPEQLVHLARKEAKTPTRLNAEVAGKIPTVKIDMPHEEPPAGIPESLQWEIGIDRDEAKIHTARLVNQAAANTILPAPVFVPSKEIVSFFEGLISLFENYKINLDETYRD